MDQGEQIRCSNCGRLVPSYHIVNCGSIENGYRQLCSPCFNAEVAKFHGLDRFEHVEFAPVELVDCQGEAHIFHFRTRLFGTGVALEAFELRDGHPAGYQVHLIGGPEDDLLALLGRLIEKIRRALSVKHIHQGTLGFEIADHLVVRGMIEWDEAQQGRVPLLVVDGREIAWEEFGRMLMGFEGWQFKLLIRDKSEEL